MAKAHKPTAATIPEATQDALPGEAPDCSEFRHELNVLRRADAYKLIHAFLTAKGHDKAALSVKKAAKSTIDLDGTMEVDGEPTLEVILEEWRKLKSRYAFLFPGTARELTRPY